MKGTSGVDTTTHSENNPRSRASQSSAGIGGNFGQGGKQENPHRVSLNKNNQKFGHQLPGNQSHDQQRLYDDPTSSKISPVPSAQALALGEQKSSSGLGGSHLQSKETLLIQHCQVLLKDAEHLDASSLEQFLVKQSKSIKGIQQLIVPTKDQVDSEETQASSK